MRSLPLLREKRRGEKIDRLFLPDGNIGTLIESICADIAAEGCVREGLLLLRRRLSWKIMRYPSLRG